MPFPVGELKRQSEWLLVDMIKASLPSNIDIGKPFLIGKPWKITIFKYF
jgi:hypothetical protein